MTPPAAEGSTPRVLVVEHEDDVGLGRLAGAWAGVLDLDVRGPAQLPGDLSGHQGLVVLGGRAAAWEDDLAPHLPATRALLVEAVAGGVPTLGICLGAQLLALATGGVVERGAAGREVGLADVHLLPAGSGDALVGPLLASPGARGTFVAAESHGDAITQLPPDAVLLATGDTYPVQAFRVGRCAWGVQYHPEVEPEDFGRWMDAAQAALAARGSDPNAARRDAAAAEPDLAALASAHAAAFAGAVLDAVARR